MKIDIPELAQQRETYRTIVLALMGFSFSATIALIIANGNVQIDLKVPVYFTLTSFLAYMVVLNSQQFKTKVWKDNISDGFFESANLSLFCVIISLLWLSKAEDLYKYLLCMLSFMVWLVDYSLRLKRISKFYKSSAEGK